MKILLENMLKMRDECRRCEEETSLVVWFKAGSKAMVKTHYVDGKLVKAEAGPVGETSKWRR